jgi:hypothetical protein
MMDGRKQFKIIVEDTLKQIIVYYLVGWIVEFILASKDVSVAIDEKIFIFTFRTWLWVDGATTVAFGFLIVFVIKLLEKFSLCFTMIYGLFKLIWIIVGFTMFVKLQF